MSFAELIRQSDANLICVQSDTVLRGLLLIKECIGKQDDDQGEEIHWFCYNVCSKDLRAELQLDDSSSRRHHFHDCFPASCFNATTRMNATEQSQSLRQKIGVSSKKLVLIIDSVSALINEDDFAAIDGIFREIYSLQKNARRCCTRLFLTTHDSCSRNAATFSKHLRYLANIWLTASHDTVSMKIKKSSGRISKQVFEYNDGDLTLVKKMNVAKTGVEKLVEDNLCSFKLDLTDQEKEARNAVQLPYVRHSDSSVNREFSATKIHYNPDEYDDWDEEEPDNDLEFV